ncbi:MoxR family ATPase [Dactylosporangium sp. NPDC049140]|uniref:AAA family ATPase n=1 Tax=Dactylosporangium sp. NPDC049140 TaxID=3155647 RepID=UPI0033D58F1D
MTWNTYYRGDGAEGDADVPVDLPEPPPWRTFPRPAAADGARFRPPDGLVEAVNAALVLRRPLLVTGPPGSGKSTLIESVAQELRLGPVLRWHITSRSTLADALYRYDVLGRIHAQQLARAREETVTDDITDFLRLGPLGAALASGQRRALLIDEIDKGDLDLPSDLLEVLERGEFEIPELVRHRDQDVLIREQDAGRDEHRIDEHRIAGGRVRCEVFPFIVLTSNGERSFPAPFLRRCVRFTMPPLTTELLTDIVRAHLGAAAAGRATELISQFEEQLRTGSALAVDQLLNVVHLLTGDAAPEPEDRGRINQLLLQELTDAS